MVKIPAAQARLFRNVFVCKRCKIKIRASPIKISEKKVKCRRCHGRNFRPIKRK
jgi:ribosomal protein L40E